MDYSYIENYLKNILNNGGMFNQQRNIMLGDINSSYNRDKQTVEQNIAQSGLVKSGLGASIMSQLAGSKDNAIAKGSAAISQEEFNAKARAIQQLLQTGQLDKNWLGVILGKLAGGLGQGLGESLPALL